VSQIRKITLCKTSDIPEAKALAFELGDSELDRIFVLRKDDQLRAYKDICPHYGATTLPWKKNEYLDGAGEFIVCAAHGAKFDIHSGECISGPCLGDFLDQVKIEVTQEDEVLACISGELQE
jgi:nitrite reductase/ring-hydroxylating ferredoxin subunit